MADNLLSAIKLPNGTTYDLIDRKSGYTTNKGTVTSVRVQATSPVQSSVSTAQNETLDTTISLADGYGDTKNPYASKTKNYVLAAPSNANGVPSFRALVAADIPISDWAKASTKPTYNASDVGAIASSAKGAANGVAELDSSGKVPSSQLPSFVDDVLEYTNKAGFPTTGEAGKIYVDKATNLTWRWSGTTYVEISPSLALGTTSSTAFRGDYGNSAYTHAVTNKGSAFSNGLYKITTNSEGHVTDAIAVTKSDITDLGIPGSNTDTQVNMIARGTTKAYLLGTTTSPTSSAKAVTSVAETGVYFDTTAATLVATKFKGAVEGDVIGTASGNLTSNSTLNPAKLDGVSSATTKFLREDGSWATPAYTTTVKLVRW